MDADLAKFRRIAKGSENPVEPHKFIQRDNTLHAIVKSDLQTVGV